MNKDLLLSFVDRVVQIDRGGPESRVGKVLAVEEDHLVVLTENDGVIYYNTHHIKSITNNAKQGFEFGLDIPENFNYLQASKFKDILNGLRHRWVQINRGGPEKLEGVLEEVTNDYVVVVAGEAIVRVSTFHLRNISYGVRIEKGKAETDGNNTGNKNNKRNNSNQKTQKKEEKAEKSGEAKKVEEETND
ncbi:hypothetical protein [Paucisalibacillus globulus]|uniref:hypothetical protein n=1 Tax=Paucisalibacillus globulus TaxID=351095 RepID=UPI0004222D97|nr:hypothetical protein [Paucisalibacillus globulus]